MVLLFLFSFLIQSRADNGYMYFMVTILTHKPSLAINFQTLFAARALENKVGILNPLPPCFLGKARECHFSQAMIF